MTDHDGIQEREAGRTRMPIGMKLLFLCLIAIGLVYMYLYSPQTTGWTQAGQYQSAGERMKKDIILHENAEVAAGASEGSASDQGPAIYKADCAMCHGDDLGGGIGPALTGPTFLYGNTLADHIRVIADGTTNGMPGFQKQLGAQKVRAVAHFIHFRHTK